MKFAQLTITPLEVATSGVQWLVTDQLGTPRMVFDKTGSLSGVSRHDYLPFGEELYAGVGGRTAQEGYAGDNVRQHFTGYEADGETGLNYAQARYQSPVQGRFTSVDPLGRSASVLNPQSFNRYSYVLNNPTNLTDPSGMMTMVDASMSYGDYSGMYVGGSDPNFGGFETGRSIIAEAQGRFGAGVQQAIALKAFNDAIIGGDVDGARDIIAANPSIGYEMNSSYNPGVETEAPPVTFTTAQLLSNDKDPTVLREAKFEPTGFGSDTATLNVETASGPAALTGDVFTVRVNFVLPEYTKEFATGRPEPTTGSRVTLGSDNRYRFPMMKETPFGSSYAFYQDAARRGHVDVSLKVRDSEATRNSILVTVAGTYQGGQSFSGRATLKLIGNNETPKRRRP